MNVFFLVVGPIIIGLGWLNAQRIQGKGKRAQAWPTAQGVVLSSSVVRLAMRGNTVLTPSVVYSYEVGGAKLESSDYRLGTPPLFNTPAKAQAAAAKYPAGSQVTVHYDPGKPQTSALELKVGDGYVGLMIYTFGATMFGFGVLGLFVGF